MAPEIRHNLDDGCFDILGSSKKLIIRRSIYPTQIDAWQQAYVLSEAINKAGIEILGQYLQQIKKAQRDAKQAMQTLCGQIDRIVDFNAKIEKEVTAYTKIAQQLIAVGNFENSDQIEVLTLEMRQIEKRYYEYEGLITEDIDGIRSLLLQQKQQSSETLKLAAAFENLIHNQK